MFMNLTLIGDFFLCPALVGLVLHYVPQQMS